jgi:hypothetical protein
VNLRFAVMAACVVACLTPTTALAAANPSNHGHHYHFGWANHHQLPAPAPAPAPKPGPSVGGQTFGVGNQIAGAPAAAAPEAPVAAIPLPTVLPPGATVNTSSELIPAVPNAWLVAILLGTLLAANVALGVWLAGRGGHYALRRGLAPVGVRV